MSFKTVRDIFEPLFVILFLVGVATAALNVNLAGFTPTIWFLMAFQALAVVICTEVGRVREYLEAKKK